MNKSCSYNLFRVTIGFQKSFIFLQENMVLNFQGFLVEFFSVLFKIHVVWSILKIKKKVLGARTTKRKNC